MSLVFVFVVLFASFKYIKDAAELSIDAWRAVSTREMTWEESAHRKAYGEIQKLGIEDFSTAAAASGSIPTYPNGFQEQTCRSVCRRPSKISSRNALFSARSSSHCLKHSPLSIPS